MRAFERLREQYLPRRHPAPPPPSRRPRLRPDSPDHLRSRPAAARARLGPVYPRRNAGAGHAHARHQGRQAAPRSAVRGRSLQALHAALQLPAVLRRRSEIPARSRPPRNRPRRTRRARPDQPASAGSRFPLRHAPGLRHPGIERFVLDGHRLRRLARADGCRRADALRLRRHRHGPGDRRRQGRRPHRHRRRRRPLRRHGLQGRRHAHRHHRAADGHQGRRHQRPAHARGARTGPHGASAHPGHHGPDAVSRAAAACRSTRRACSCCNIPDRQDPRPDRPRRQEDSLHHRSHRRQDRRHGRRQGARLRLRRHLRRSRACR